MKNRRDKLWSINLLGGSLNKYNSPKLQKFKENNNKRKAVVTAIILSFLLLSVIYLYSSFVLFTEEKKLIR